MKTKNQTIEIAENKIAQVIMPIPVDTPFSYSIPVDLLDLILPGVQVTVPFGERYSAGIVLSIGEPEDDAEFELKPIHGIAPISYKLQRIKGMQRWGFRLLSEIPLRCLDK